MIFVTVLTHNRADQLKRLIESPHFGPELAQHGARLLILNQGSTDGTEDYLQHVLGGNPREYVWNAAQNAGIIAGHQRQVDWLLGYGLAKRDIVVFLDDDVTPTAAGWLRKLIAPMDAPDVVVTGCFGAKVTAEWQMEQVSEPGPVDIVNMSHTAVRADVFLEGFEFPLHFGSCWHEDAALCLWARAHGSEVEYVGTPESIGLHHDPHHKSTDDLYWRNWRLLKEQYHGFPMD